jgi:hypothetical protein
MDVLGRGFQIRLDGVVDDYPPVAVEPSHEVNRPCVDRRLEDLLFCVDPKAGVLGCCGLADIFNSLCDRGRWNEVAARKGFNSLRTCTGESDVR